MTHRFTTAYRVGGAGLVALSGLMLWLLFNDAQRQLPWVAAILPVLPGAIMVIAVLFAFPAMDEMERRYHTEAMFIGFGLSMLMFLVVGLLQAFASWPPVNLALAGATMSAFWGIGLLIAWRRYR